MSQCQNESVGCRSSYEVKKVHRGNKNRPIQDVGFGREIWNVKVNLCVVFMCSLEGLYLALKAKWKGCTFKDHYVACFPHNTNYRRPKRKENRSL